MMICPHLRALETELLAAGVAETFRGKAWTNNCRQWVYFDCFLDTAALRKRLNLAECVIDHVNDDVRSGQERGLACTIHHDGIIGHYERQKGKPVMK